MPGADQIIETLTLRSGFNTNTVILGTSLLGFAAGVVGVYTLLRKRALVSDALAHATLPGIAAAFLLAPAFGLNPRSIPLLLIGAATSAAAAVLTLQLLKRSRRLSEDAAIGAVLSVTFAIGVVALSYIQRNAPSGSAGLQGLIFGQAAAMRPQDAMLMGSICVVVLAVTAVLLKELTIVGFNESFASVSGWRVGIIDLVMLTLVILVTVSGLQAVGLLMIIALLIIPPVAARYWTDRMSTLLILSGTLGALSGYCGAVVSALFPSAPAGAVIVLAAGAVFTISMLAAPRRGIIASVLHTTTTKLRIACDHACETGIEHPDSTLTQPVFSALAHGRGWNPIIQHIVRFHLSASGRAKRLSSGALELTQAGKARGRRVARNHALWTQYLTEYADVAPTHVDWSVDQVEHILAPEIIERLERNISKSTRGGTP